MYRIARAVYFIHGPPVFSILGVVVEPCSSSPSDADGIPQRWTVDDGAGEGAGGGQIISADGRCLTAALSPAWFNECPGLVLAPCSNSSGLAARQRWRFDRGVRTISGIVSSSAASASGLPASHSAVSVVAPAPIGTGGDWYSVALFKHEPESLCRGAACQNETAHHATTPQMWYHDRAGRHAQGDGRLQAMSTYKTSCNPWEAAVQDAKTRGGGRF